MAKPAHRQFDPCHGVPPTQTAVWATPSSPLRGPEKYFDDTSCSIAVKAGIGASKHFSKAFKLVTGMTLMQFKKRK